MGVADGHQSADNLNPLTYFWCHLGYFCGYLVVFFGYFFYQSRSRTNFVTGVADANLGADNLNPLTRQPAPIGRLGEQKYGI